MKKTSELLAEFVGRPGHEDLAPILGEVQFMEQFNDLLTAFVAKAYAETKRLMEQGHEIMERTHTPERMAEIKDEAERFMAEAKARDELRKMLESITSATPTPDDFVKDSEA